MNRSVFVILLSVLVVACNASQPTTDSSKTLETGGPAMGTQWSVVWVADASQGGMEHEAVTQALVDELARINALMSTWDSASELSLFNTSSSIEPVELHADTLTVIDTALPISRLTSGRYDITLKPVIDLWGFSRDTVTSSPDEDDITAALEKTGYSQLVRVGRTIRKRNPDVSIDVSSLAKGYAVDKLGELLEDMGISRYLVDIGGELRARGTRADGLMWRVGIETPEGEVQQIVALQDSHIASSGSYRNYRIENGKRLSHIIDGATGRPIEHQLVSVNVVHQSTMLADAWATALLVLGEADAIEIMQQQALEAQLTVYRDGRFERIASEEFSALLVD